MSRLDELKARVEGHTEGPWHNRGDVIAFEVGASLFNLCEAPQKETDAELIAAAPKLLAALEAVEAVITEHATRTPWPDADKESQWYSLGKQHGYERVLFEIQEALA